MSFAIYGESQAYVHLTSSDTRDEVIKAFLTDLSDVGVDIAEVFNVFAVEDSREDKELEDEIRFLINEASYKTN